MVAAFWAPKIGLWGLSFLFKNRPFPRDQPQPTFCLWPPGRFWAQQLEGPYQARASWDTAPIRAVHSVVEIAIEHHNATRLLYAVALLAGGEKSQPSGLLDLETGLAAIAKESGDWRAGCYFEIVAVFTARGARAPIVGPHPGLFEFRLVVHR